MDSRTINDHYAEIGADLIASEDALVDIANSGATIIYLSSEHKKMSSGKVVHAECEKISDKYKWGIPCDFTIKYVDVIINRWEKLTGKKAELING